jgi:ubiquinone/menaquinone biosynthesis C-methylase UbiE
MSGSEVDCDSNSRFNKKAYWDERFRSEDKYDWLMEFQHVEKDLVPLLKPTDHILIVGCGNSTFSRSIYDAGFKNIVNIDYSGVVIENMRKVNADCDGMSWVEMDMTKLAFDEASFDVVLDKAAMDALVVEEGDVWDPEVSVIETVHQMCTSVRRVLVPGGRHIQISFAQPHFRTKYLMGYRHSGTQVSPYESHNGHSELYDRDLTFRTINKGAGSLDIFMYIMDIPE